MTARVLAERSLQLAPVPGGKRIRAIHIATTDIISPDDPYPDLLNTVHVTTQESVIRRELLFSEGEVWIPALIEETERNLRRLSIIALAQIVPVVSAAGGPDEVDVLVVTKDLWSIRINSSFNVVGTLLQYLRVRPTEQNLFGRDKQLSGDFELKLDTVAFGQSFVDRRVMGTRLTFGERASLIFNRATRRLEGTEGQLVFGRPLYSLDTTWAFNVDARWDVRRVRVFRGAEVWTLRADDGEEEAPWVYDQRELDGAAFYTRSFGRSFKWNVSAGAGAFSHAYQPPPGLSEGERALVQERILPASEDVVYAALKLHAFAPEYRVLRNVESFALSEDYQAGPNARAELRGGRLLRDEGAFFEAGVSARYRFVFHDALLALSAAGSGRFCPSTCSDATWVNQRVAAEALHVTPFVGIGRFAVRGLYEAHRNELDQTLVLLGGGNGLRGVQPEALSGTQLFLLNLEYRTRPLELFTVHVGAVAFYDVGAVLGGESEDEGATHTVGLGLRFLFPQFDVEPLRIDFGYVLAGSPNPRPYQRISSSFGQVNRYRPRFLDEPFR